MQADLAGFRIEHDYDTIVAIGLLMFFRKERALALLRQIGQRVSPGGCAIINVLVEGTTYLGHVRARTNIICLARASWSRLLRRLEHCSSTRHDSFPAPESARKEFATVIAQKAPNPA